MKQVSKKLRVLVVMPTLDICGGIERFFMNYYSYMPDNISFYIITHHSDSKKYQKMIEERNDNLLVLPKFNIRNYSKIKKETDELLRNNKFDVIHCQMANAGFLYLRLAKKYGIKNRILHSHQCKYADKLSHAIRNIPCIFLAKKYANNFVACGEDAGKFMFRNDEFEVLNNALDPTIFTKNIAKRNQIRKKLKIEKSKIVLGSVGRLEPQKNHQFSMKIVEKCDDFDLLIIGNGSEKEKLHEYAKEHNIIKRTHFIESTDSIIDYYSAMDALVMPSIYEGLPLVGVEAQFCGLPCYFSDSITKELKISNNVYFIDITRDDPSIWINLIAGTCKKGNNLSGNSEKYNIETQISNLEHIYSRYMAS